MAVVATLVSGERIIMRRDLLYFCPGLRFYQFHSSGPLILGVWESS
jgi:hypothetical protein